MSTFKLEELAREADVSPRTVRYYVQRGLLPPPDFKGSQTTYGPAHLLRLRAIKVYQDLHWPLEQIAAELGGKSVADLERLLKNGNSTHRVSKKIAGPTSPYRSAPLPPPPAAHAVPTTTRPETWQRIELVPGVELHVKADASPLARRIAREIHTNYGTYDPTFTEEVE